MKKHLDAMLAGGPLVAQQVIDATALRLRDSGATMALATDRQHLFEVLEALQIHQLALTTAFGCDIKAEIESASQVQVNAVRLPAGPLRLEDLTLMDEDQAEKDIEISRTIQLIDLKAEWELRELQALTATLLGETVLRLEANPCRPMVYARALSRAAHDLRVSKASRGMFLRTAGFAMADVLRDVYGDACRRLKSWGLQPLEFRSAAIVRAGTTPEVDLTQPDALLSLRERLPKRSATDEPPQQQTVELLSRLFEQILADPRLQSSVKDVIGRLQASVVRVALTDPTLMSSHEHPAWSLINQIAAHASDHPQFSDSRGSAFMEFVEPLIERLAVEAAPSAALYEGALSDVQAFIDREDETQLQHSQAAVKALAEAEQRQTLMPLLRQQVMHQLQSAELSETLRRFLTGPWVEVLARTMVSQGTDNPHTQALVGTVDELLWSLERPASELDRDEVRQRLPSLVERLKMGMEMIGLPQTERDHVLDDLMRAHSRRLRGAPAGSEAKTATPQDLVQQMRDEVLDDDQEQGADSWTQDTSVGALPTVPMALGGAEEDGRVKAAAQRWLQTLTKGVRCKLFLQGQWVTAHLLWRSDNGEFFMFTSSLAGGMHSMTRRALERLRIEGLATTFVELSLMQRAVDSVLQDLDEA
ncbi:DUF1631 family protein [Aquabacterium sp.]|uniref:DUF1631 family protein n=1 Tax=Aquabacterium sp. TaxID=1872578 RepID=UPI002489B1B7|nr:DUF1631 family protein [Aquabacterium sp.]MDI1260578.1 DUF1631 family protein [Aquabacterium sp.]